MLCNNPFVDNLYRHATANSIHLTLKWLDHQPDYAVLRLLQLLGHLAPTPSDKQFIQNIRQSWLTNDSYGQLWRRLLHEVSQQNRKNLIYNLLVNNAWGPPRAKRQAFKARTSFEPPFAYLISPSMRCNLHCVGCYAGEYSIKDDLPIETVERVLNEGKEMGIHFVTVLGGEPFVRKDMWEVYTRHQDVEFMVFTNGTTLTQNNVDRIEELGNILPVVSIEGWENDTDQRRGEGVFTSIMAAFERMRKAQLLFGFSSMVTSRNIETICSDAFNQAMVEQGCLFGWHFLYMPVGNNPDLSLMPTAQQREYLRTHGASRIRETMPLLVMDFWNDAPFVGGCIAAGRSYFHINNRGDVEPCIFVHFASDNIHEKPLSECLESKFFKAIRARQPYNENLLLPCMLIDNPQIFREICAECHPHATHFGAEALITDLAPGIDSYATEVQAVMGEAWRETQMAKTDIEANAV